MAFTKEEIKLLAKLAKGTLDGFVGDEYITQGGSSIWMAIKNGVPTKFKQGPSKRFFNGKENEVIQGVLHILQKWSSDKEKLQFLQKFGWLMKDPDVLAYSAKFKPVK